MTRASNVACLTFAVPLSCHNATLSKLSLWHWYGPCVGRWCCEAWKVRSPALHWPCDTDELAARIVASLPRHVVAADSYKIDSVICSRSRTPSVFNDVEMRLLTLALSVIGSIYSLTLPYSVSLSAADLLSPSPLGGAPLALDDASWSRSCGVAVGGAADWESTSGSRWGAAELSGCRRQLAPSRTKKSDDSMWIDAVNINIVRHCSSSDCIAHIHIHQFTRLRTVHTQHDTVTFNWIIHKIQTESAYKVFFSLSWPWQ